MPIRPEDKARYLPAREWRALRASILERAGNACECRGECGDEHDGADLPGSEDGRCDAPNGERIGRFKPDMAAWSRFEGVEREVGERLIGSDFPHEDFTDGSIVVLTIAHLDHTSENNDPSNLRALCQRCHLLLGKDQHRETSRRTRDRRKGQESLFEKG